MPSAHTAHWCTGAPRPQPLLQDRHTPQLHHPHPPQSRRQPRGVPCSGYSGQPRSSAVCCVCVCVYVCRFQPIISADLRKHRTLRRTAAQHHERPRATHRGPRDPSAHPRAAGRLASSSCVLRFRSCFGCVEHWDSVVCFHRK
jgi:hypothetical protein